MAIATTSGFEAARAPGFRAWRLERYFAKTPAERLISPDSGKG
jgi:hypothetical protein